MEDNQMPVGDETQAAPMGEPKSPEGTPVDGTPVDETGQA